MLEYPSNISRKQFEHVKPILESAKKSTRPRTLDLYDVFCAVLYVLKTGCQWRALPHDFPKWSSVYMYFRTWSFKKDDEDSILETVLKKNGNISTYTKWQKTQDEFLYNRRSECEKH
jgi:transposase